MVVLEAESLPLAAPEALSRTESALAPLVGEGEAEEELPPLWARERTMSFLQMGQVRRRVVSHGVLGRGVSLVISLRNR